MSTFPPQLTPQLFHIADFIKTDDDDAEEEDDAAATDKKAAKK